MKLTAEQVIQCKASICRNSFFEFVKEFWSIIVAEEPVFNWHVEVLCDELQKVAENVFDGWPKDHDLIVNVPPGSSKSTICSQAFPAWCWTRMPSAKFICGSYAQQVALKDSLKTRDIILSEKYRTYFPGITLRDDENMKGLFTNTHMGFRLSVGVGGFVTGYHGHFLLVDDPLNPEESYSEAELKSVNRWMSTTLPTRKVNKSVTPMILIQQRLHMQDPTGTLLQRGGVRHICLPGELTKDVSPPELAARYRNGLLDPVRLSKESLEKLYKELGEYGYAAQVLQTPIPLGGGQFQVDKLNFVHTHNRIVKICRSWDKAGTKDGGAWSVGVKMGIQSNGRYVILNVVRGQWGSAKREEMIRMTAEMDGDEVPVLIEIEGGSGGKESGENTVINLAGYRVFAYHPTGDKETRAYPFSCAVGGGIVDVIIDPTWNKDYVEELQHFPASKFKDQVDASSGAFNWLAKKAKLVGGVKL